jgi:hypothetical protein
MKRLILMLALTCSVAHACVHLGTAVSQTWPGASSATDAYAEVLSYNVDLLHQTSTIIFTYGSATVSGGYCTAFTHDPQAQTVAMILYWNPSNPYTWTSSNGGSGVLNGTDLTNLNTGMTGGLTALINAFDTLATTKSVFNSGSSTAGYLWNATPTVQ